jgi:hypothetical protein
MTSKRGDVGIRPVLKLGAHAVSHTKIRRAVRLIFVWLVCSRIAGNFINIGRQSGTFARSQNVHGRITSVIVVVLLKRAPDIGNIGFPLGVLCAVYIPLPADKKEHNRQNSDDNDNDK